jgi:hypothetical protein
MRSSSRGLLAAAYAALLFASAASASHGAPARAPLATSATPAPARDWSDPPDFEALRAEFAARADFSALCEDGRPVSAAFEALQGERWNELLALTEPWTERCPVDMEAHALLATALQRAGRPEEAEAHDMWSRGLFEAVLATGDGKSPETAYRVLAEFEEYALLRMFRYPPERQQAAPNGVDEMTVRADGEAQLLYFEPATHAAARVAKLESGSAQR